MKNEPSDAAKMWVPLDTILTANMGLYTLWYLWRQKGLNEPDEQAQGADDRYAAA